MVFVPLYDTLGPESMTFIINQAELELVVCDTYKKIKLLAENSHKLSPLKRLVVIRDNDDEFKGESSSE